MHDEQTLVYIYSAVHRPDESFHPLDRLMLPLTCEQSHDTFMIALHQLHEADSQMLHRLELPARVYAILSNKASAAGLELQRCTPVRSSIQLWIKSHYTSAK